MLISLIKYPVNTLGPGNRIGIWTSGCNKNCPGCMSSFSKDFDSRKEKSIGSIIKEIKRFAEQNDVDGITISGGEPFEQKDILQLLIQLRKIGIEDILVYTGFLIEEISSQKDALKYIDVLIDGPYIDELNDNKPLRGSSNQRIFIFNKKLKEKYLSYLKHPRKFDICFENEIVTIIGILPKGGYAFVSEMLK